MKISSLGELAIRRPLKRAGDQYAPGQALVTIIDPRPHRDRADLAALLAFVDEDGVLWDISCMRYRDERGWRAFKVGRFTAHGRVGNTHTAAALGYELSPEHLALIETVAADARPFPFEEPSDEEQRFRGLAHALLKAVSHDR